MFDLTVVLLMWSIPLAFIAYFKRDTMQMIWLVSLGIMIVLPLIGIFIPSFR